MQLAGRFGRLFSRQESFADSPPPSRPRGATEKLDLAIEIIEKSSLPGDDAYACLPGFWSAKCMILAAMHLPEEGLEAAYRGLRCTRELAQGTPGRFESQLATLLLHAAEFHGWLGHSEEAADAQREAKRFLGPHPA